MSLSPRRRRIQHQQGKNKKFNKSYTQVNGNVVRLATIFICVTIVMIMFLGVQIANFMKKNVSGNPSSLEQITVVDNESPTLIAEPVPTEPTYPTVVNTATIGVMGDLLMHKPVIDACATLENSKEYDFSEIFQHIDDVITPLDYSIINLETTFAGDSKPYQGNPMFNCPDNLAVAVKNAGFDMLTTANNHCFDTGMDGYLRTLQVAADNGLDTTGTYAEDTDNRYFVKDINGIKVGFINYTYETSKHTGQVPQLNGINMKSGSYNMINTFVTTAPQMMFEEVSAFKTALDEENVDITVALMHWGTEYSLIANKHQNYIAQTFANMGIDVIVGAHPHVVQPVEIFDSETNPNHKLICVYSLGNAVSNQRLGNLNSVKTAHTEDGALCTISIEKYSNGEAFVSSVDIIPTWVNMKTGENYRDYIILPLLRNESNTWENKFNLSSHEIQLCEESYARTMEIVGPGLDKCSAYLESARVERENNYRKGPVETSVVVEKIDNIAS